ncbi:uncharacterized protein LOC126899106 isoform X2 [Daktulosphaira vitifoliae]|nr:uncharacterized protein LOC126899106 isoform X2 [Daktulosphaira vitifoliae]
MDWTGNRRHTGQGSSAASGISAMDLSGYALHQRLRSAAGAEMYVTGLRAKVLDSGGLWAQVDPAAGCRYRPDLGVLEARMRFGRPLQVIGTVRLVYPDGRRIVGFPDGTTPSCDMAVRLRSNGRRVGLGFTAAPVGSIGNPNGNNRLESGNTAGTITIRTTATFIDNMEDNYSNDLGTTGSEDGSSMPMLSVHAYNCIGMGHGSREQMLASATDDNDQFEQILNGNEELLSSEEEDDGHFFDTDGGLNNGEDDHFSFESDTGRRTAISQHKQQKKQQQQQPQLEILLSTEPPPKNPAGFITSSDNGSTDPEPRLRLVKINVNRPKPLSPVHHYYQEHNAPLQNHDNNQASTIFDDKIMMEMEETFVRGVRRLLARHLERAVQPALRDSLMRRMGYAASYG